MFDSRTLGSRVEGWPILPEDVELGFTHGIAVDSQGRIIVFNMSKHAVVVLDPEGRYLFSWGEEFAEGAHGLHLYRDHDGEECLILTDIERHLVAKYTLDGRELLNIAAPPVSEIYPSAESFKPTDADVAPNGDIYVVDGYGQYYVHRYDRNGRWLECWEAEGAKTANFKSRTVYG
ncbi:hypothetical protein D7Z26_01150 [Cohnella endophytica]|uniref:6-bladed beta-propeller n=1 Tax=Cohnella endophytica TaxID=2419778 RepID=A0A494YCY6_9BACL|nr:hypothetical protein [Cohnella endophytica]RKP58141.1 hypothetical protein D7Z26_01150 [Cohnella endophytica]